MIINPLLFMPSPRNIPDVTKWWDLIPYDKFIVKDKKQLPAYNEGRNFFENHPEYTHFIICPDDLEVTPEAVIRILGHIKNKNYAVIAAICNLDETQKDTYAIQPMGCDYSKDHPDATFGRWYSTKNPPLLPKGIIQVGHCGFSCQVISREVLQQVSWQGATTSSSNAGNFDWQFSRDCHKLGIPIHVDTDIRLYHRRKEQYLRIKEMLSNYVEGQGYSYLSKAN